MHANRLIRVHDAARGVRSACTRPDGVWAARELDSCRSFWEARRSPSASEPALSAVIEQQIDLIAADAARGSIPPSALGEILRAIEPTVRKSVRMAFEGRSGAAGRRPIWLAASSETPLKKVDVRRDRTVLTFEMHRLGDAAKLLYEQTDLFATLPDPDLTALDMFAGVLSDVAKSNEGSDRYDRSLLRGLLMFETGLDRTFSRLELRGGATTQTLDRPLVGRARELHDRTPPGRQIRIVGTLDMLRVSTSSFGLKLDDGTEVRCVMASNDISVAQPFLGQRLLVHGCAVYKPSGKLLRVDAEALESGIGAPALWNRVPEPIRSAPGPQQLRGAGSRAGGLNAFFGKWPGDETESELLMALSEL